MPMDGTPPLPFARSENAMPSKRAALRHKADMPLLGRDGPALERGAGFPGSLPRNREKISVLHKGQNVFRGETSRIFGWRGFSPIISIRYCSRVSSAASAGVRGQEKEPSSSLLYKSRKPFPSHNSPLMRSFRFPQKRMLHPACPAASRSFDSRWSEMEFEMPITMEPERSRASALKGSFPRSTSVRPGAGISANATAGWPCGSVVSAGLEVNWA